MMGRRWLVMNAARIWPGCRCGGGFVVAGLGEPFGGELADGLQQP
jgi:hypothetical protein